MIDIRAERLGEADAIRALTEAAFKDAPRRSGMEGATVDALRAAGVLMLSLIAVEGDKIVSHAAFSPVTIDCESGSWFGLGPISVQPDRQGRGVGKALIQRGLAQLAGRAPMAASCSAIRNIAAGSGSAAIRHCAAPRAAGIFPAARRQRRAAKGRSDLSCWFRCNVTAHVFMS